MQMLLYKQRDTEWSDVYDSDVSNVAFAVTFQPVEQLQYGKFWVLCKAERDCVSMHLVCCANSHNTFLLAFPHGQIFRPLSSRCKGSVDRLQHGHWHWTWAQSPQLKFLQALFVCAVRKKKNMPHKWCLFCSSVQFSFYHSTFSQNYNI